MHSPRLLHPVRLCLYGFALLTSAHPAWASSTPGLDQPEPVGAYFNGVFPTSPPGDPSGWAVENAFPNLSFTDPMTIQEVPVASGSTTQFLVVGKNGQIWRFPKTNPTAVQKVMVLDHTAKTETSEDQGFYSLAFHPQFATSGAAGENKVYVCYNRRAVSGTDDNDRTYWTVSRFTWVPGTGTLDPNSESILISQYDPHRFHNGGSTFFGDDGFLYITNGDGGLGGDGLDNSQRINMGLFGGILRIDVNNDPAKSHAIRRQPLEDANWWLDNPTQVQPKPAEWPASFTQGYGIPNDNPWLAANGSILEEFFAIGLRSPHSAHFDPVTDDIWVGEVGEANREELIRVTKGANCQWAYLEGTRATSKNKPNPLTGFDQVPHYEYDHSVGNSIITGPRYRGTKWASLTGKVIFGDHVRGKIWSATVPASGAPVITEMNSSFDTGYKKGLCGFYADSGGDIFIMNLAGSNNPAGKIMKLAVPAVSAEPPELLSQTGVFTNLSTLATAAGVIPYDVPNPLWSDAAAKKRWIILPNDGTFNSAAEDIVFSDEGNWTFPAGTVFVKHFETNTNANNPSAIKRLETRFLICTANGGKYGFTYKWNAAGTDATLLHNGESENYNYTTSGGGTEARTWSYPSRGDCMVCHNDVSGQALGVKTATFASKFLYPSTGRTSNQLETFNSLGAFNVTLTATQMENAIESRALTDETAPLEHRIRSYIATNCSHCHQPGGSGAGFDARLGTPLDLQNIINGIPERYEALGPDGRYIKPADTSLSAMFVRASAVGNGDAMPPLAKNMAHTAGIAAMQSYINGLVQSQFNVTAAPKARYVRVKSLSGNRTFAAIREFQVLDGTGVIIPYGQLSIKDVDSESGTTNVAGKIIDGSLGTSNLWQSLSSPTHPHQITIDMGSVRELGGYVYYPRYNSSGDGRIANYQILISEDYVNWTTFDSSTTSGPWSLTTTDPTIYAPGYNKRAARTQLAGPTTPVEGSFEATVVFDQDVTGFTSSDFNVTNGTVTALRGSGYYYVASISPAPGATQVNVSIPLNAAVPDPLGSLAASKGTLASQTLNVTISPDSQPPTSPGNLQGTPGLFSVQLSWTASSDNIGVTEYQVWRGGSLIATVPGLSYTDNSVTVETQYQYQVIARDALANSSVPAAVTVTTLADTQAPTTPGNLNGTPSLFSIQLAWNPSSDNLGVTDYQVWRNGTLIATVSSPGYTDNDRPINTQYNYGVVALDAKGNASAAATLTISTLADTTAPTVPGNFAGTPGLVSVQLSWNAATDNVGVTDYEVKRNGVMIATVSGLNCTDNDLTPNTGYTYQVRAIDGSNNKSSPSQISVTTLADTTAPSVPGSPNATPGLVSVQLTWNASTDNLGVTGYQVKRNGVTVATVPGPGYTDNDLEAETLYSYQVRALDAAGNASGPASVSTTTLADSSPPTTPGNFNGTPAMLSVSLSWSASTDNLGVTGYHLLRDGLPVTSVPGLGYVDTGLQPDTTYHYELAAVDAKGNASPLASVYMITLPDTQAPGAPGNLEGVPDFRNVALSWNAAEDNMAVTGYKVFRGGNLVATVPGLSFNDTGLERGTTYHYEVKATDLAGNLSGAAVLNVETYGFDEWLEQYELGGQTDADSDHGGVDNLTEYYLEMNPNDHHDDWAFRLVVQPQGANIHVVYPALKPLGNYHLHYSTSLAGLSNTANRINTLTRAQIEAMSPAQRSSYATDLPKDANGCGYFLLIFDPPVSE